MYLYNSSENSQRVNYYGADYTPHAYINGDRDVGSNYAAWDYWIGIEEDIASPIQINLNVDYDEASNSGTVEAVISATEEITYTNMKLRMAITENHIPDEPGGSPFDEFNHCMRDMLPTATGNTVTIAKGEVVTFSEPYTLDLVTTVWDNLEIVAWVQSDNGKRVLQAANQAFPGAHVSLSPAGSSVQVPLGGTLSFDAALSNNAGNNLSGDFWVTVRLPSGAEILVPEANLSGANPYAGTLPAWTSPTLAYDLYIPSSGIPTGVYSLVGHIGVYPDVEVSTSFFDFEITP